MVTRGPPRAPPGTRPEHPTAETVTQGAALGIDDLERFGMPFAREGDGRISQRCFGAHKYRRTAFAGDCTGLEIQHTLVRRASRLDVGILDTVCITRLLVHDGAVFPRPAGPGG